MTALQTDDLNNAKVFYEEIPALDGDELDVQVLEGILTGGNLSPDTYEVVRSCVAKAQDGKVSFGDVMPLIREGKRGSMSPAEMAAIRSSLSEPVVSVESYLEEEEEPSAKAPLQMSRAPPLVAEAVTVADVLQSVPQTQLLDSLREAYNKRAGSDARVTWADLSAIATDLGDKEHVSSDDMAMAVENIAPSPPSEEKSTLDFEDW